MNKLPKIGTKVRLIKSRHKKSAKVIAHVTDTKGGVQLEEPLDGFRYWNMLDLQPSPSPD